MKYRERWYEYPSGHTTCNPCGLLVDITRTSWYTKFPRCFHVDSSTRKISTCILLGNFHVYFTRLFEPGNIPRGFHMEISTWKISTCILRGSIHVECVLRDKFNLFLAWKISASFPCGKIHEKNFHVILHRSNLMENFHLRSAWLFLSIFHVNNFNIVPT